MPRAVPKIEPGEKFPLRTSMQILEVSRLDPSPGAPGFPVLQIVVGVEPVDETVKGGEPVPRVEVEVEMVLDDELGQLPEEARAERILGVIERMVSRSLRSAAGVALKGRRVRATMKAKPAPVLS